MQAEWRKLAVLIDGWAQADEIPAVERDLALEKLRNLYDAIRFAGAAPETAPEPIPGESFETREEILPESIDLGEMLSMEELSDLAEPAGPIFVEPATRFAAERESAEIREEPAAAEAADDIVPEAAPAVIRTAEVAEPAAQPVSEPIAEPKAEPGVGQIEPLEPAPAAESEASGVGQIEPLEPAPAAESEAPEATAPEAPETAASEASEATPPETIEVSEAVPSEAPETTAPEVSESPEAAISEASSASGVSGEVIPEASGTESPEVSLETVSPEPAPSEPAKHRHAAPTLFGMEDEETLRHRHKQRVIMSLYGSSPEPEHHPSASGSAAERKAAMPHGTALSHPESNLSVPDPEKRAPETSETEDLVEVTLTPESGSVPASGTQPHPFAESRAEASTPDTPQEGDEADFEPTLSEITISGAASDPASVVTEHSRPADPETPAWHVAETSSEPMSGAELPHPQGGAVLGEVINPHMQTLADTIAPPHDIASELRRNEPVTDLRRAIGLNDKFLLIRDLFGGDAQAYERAVETLNDFDDLDDCMIFIAEHYAWNPNSDGAKLMMELLERKFA